MTDEIKAMTEDGLLAAAKTFQDTFKGEGNEDNLYQHAYDYITELKAENAVLQANLKKIEAKAEAIKNAANEFINDIAAIPLYGAAIRIVWQGKLYECELKTEKEFEEFQVRYKKFTKKGADK